MKNYPTGTVRDWSGVKMRKQGDGSWKPASSVGPGGHKPDRSGPHGAGAGPGGGRGDGSGVKPVEISDDAIQKLAEEAGAHGDEEQVQICKRALRGVQADRAECARVLQEAEERSLEKSREAAGMFEDLVKSLGGDPLEATVSATALGAVVPLDPPPESEPELTLEQAQESLKKSGVVPITTPAGRIHMETALDTRLAAIIETGDVVTSHYDLSYYGTSVPPTVD